MLDWYELNLLRKPPSFVLAHRLVKLIAIPSGFAVTLLSLMAVAGAFVERLTIHVFVATAVAIAVPALCVRLLRAKEGSLALIGHTTDTVAVVLFGFAVAFIIAAHGSTAPLLAREGDRAAQAGWAPVARAEWFLARVAPR